MNTPSSTVPADNLHHRAHRRSHHIYASLGVGFLVIVVWAFSRIAVCWGDYSILGIIGCHSQWLTFFGLLAGVIVLILLMRDLSHPHLQHTQGRQFRRTRAAWRGYRSLEKPAARHVTASTLLLLVSILLFAWLIFLSPVRF